MDPITALALSVHNPFLTAIDQLLDNDIFYIVIILASGLIAESKKDKRIKIIVSLALAFCLALTVKYIVAEPRPCAGFDWCPSDSGFPSNHAVVAFTLALGFLNRKSFPFFLAFALFVSFTRLNLGVHDFWDIVGAVPVALVAYYVIDIVWVKYEKKLKVLFKIKS